MRAIGRQPDIASSVTAAVTRQSQHASNKISSNAARMTTAYSIIPISVAYSETLGFAISHRLPPGYRHDVQWEQMKIYCSKSATEFLIDRVESPLKLIIYKFQWKLWSSIFRRRHLEICNINNDLEIIVNQKLN